MKEKRKGYGPPGANASYELRSWYVAASISSKVESATDIVSDGGNSLF